MEWILNRDFTGRTPFKRSCGRIKFFDAPIKEKLYINLRYSLYDDGKQRFSPEKLIRVVLANGILVQRYFKHFLGGIFEGAWWRSCTFKISRSSQSSWLCKGIMIWEESQKVVFEELNRKVLLVSLFLFWSNNCFSATQNSSNEWRTRKHTSLVTQRNLAILRSKGYGFVLPFVLLLLPP